MVYFTLVPLVPQMHLLVISQVPQNIIKMYILVSWHVIVACNKLSQNLVIKVNIFFFACFVGQEFRKSSAGQFFLRTSYAGAVRCWLRLQSSKGSVGLDIQAGSLAWIAGDASSWLRAQLRLSSRVVHSDFLAWYSQGIWTSYVVDGFYQSKYPIGSRLDNACLFPS